MPVTASLTLWGMYQYDPTILSGLQLPDGMDADTVTDNLLLETAALELLYPDPNFLKKAITIWSAERIDVWQKLYNTTVLEYDPIENYDRKEESLETAAGSVVDQRTHNRTAEQSAQVSGSQTGSRNTRTDTAGSDSSSRNTRTDSAGSDSSNRMTRKDTAGSDVTNRIGSNESIAANTAYDSNAFANTAKNNSSGSDQTQASRTETESDSDQTQASRTETGSGSESTDSSSTEASAGRASEKLHEDGSRSSEDQRRVSSRIHGNIGVTTTQQMLQSEREVAEFCMVDYIINDFIGKFCVMVY